MLPPRSTSLGILETLKQTFARADLSAVRGNFEKSKQSRAEYDSHKLNCVLVRLTWPAPQTSLLFVNQLLCSHWLPKDLNDGKRRLFLANVTFKVHSSTLIFYFVKAIIHIYDEGDWKIDSNLGASSAKRPASDAVQQYGPEADLSLKVMFKLKKHCSRG